MSNNKKVSILARALNKLVYILPDKLYLKLLFYDRVGYWPDIENPRSFNEKLQWLKLNDKRKDYTKMVDKIDAKDFVSDIIGEKYIIPTIGVWDTVDDIDWETLPNQFVIKVTSDSGGVVVCRDKARLNIEEAKAKLYKGWGKNYYKRNKEYPYCGLTPRIIAEKYIAVRNVELLDYKFMCYNGVCKNLFVCSGRYKDDLRVDFFDTEWNHLPFYRKYPNADYEIPRPENLNEMILCANDIASKVQSPFVRIDLYSIDGKIYFGEITFFPGSGMEFFCPVEWDFKLGDMIQLPCDS